MAAEMPAEALLEFMYLAPVGIVSCTADGTIEMANPAASALLMPFVTDGDMSDLYRVLADVAPDLRRRVAAHAADHGVVCDHMRLAVAGSRTVLTLSLNKISPNRLMAAIQDISRLIEQEIIIRDDQRRLAAIFEHVRDYAIFTVDLAGQIEAWNRSLERIGGWQASDVVGSPFSMCFPADETGAPLCWLARASSARPKWSPGAFARMAAASGATASQP